MSGKSGKKVIAVENYPLLQIAVKDHVTLIATLIASHKKPAWRLFHVEHKDSVHRLFHVEQSHFAELSRVSSQSNTTAGTAGVASSALIS